MIEDTYINIGGEVKALEEDGDNLKVGGYIVLYGSPEVSDMSSYKDYFTKSTDYELDILNKGVMRWHHCMDPKIGDQRFGLAEAKADDDDEVGVWAEGWMQITNKYAEKVRQWIKEKRVGWSSTAQPHLIKRRHVGKGIHEVEKWPLGGGDYTLTMAPMDPRQVGSVMTLKAFQLGEVDSTTLIDSVSRLGSDANDLVPALARAHGARQSEGRTLAVEKLAVIKSLNASLKSLNQSLEKILSESERLSRESSLEDIRAKRERLGNLLAGIQL